MNGLHIPFEGDSTLAHVANTWKTVSRKTRLPYRRVSTTDLPVVTNKLYVLAHGARDSALIYNTAGTESMTPDALAALLESGGLRRDVRAVCVWACYSAINGFAEAFAGRLHEAGFGGVTVRGYTTSVIAYSSLYGGGHKHAVGDGGERLGFASEYKIDIRGAGVVAQTMPEAVFVDWDSDSE